jgi:hypothetical protein
VQQCSSAQAKTADGSNKCLTGRDISSMQPGIVAKGKARCKSGQGQDRFRKCHIPHSSCHAMPTFLKVSPPLTSLHHDDCSCTPRFGKLHIRNTREWREKNKGLFVMHSFAAIEQKKEKKKEYVQERNRRAPFHALGSPSNIIAPIVPVINDLVCR